ncbi:MAG: DUF362 domain-containing protein [Deltaproteobacteria bacterium]|nr:MAG: DUF362 domain-containing protein [Deltaproteobacteria bacterium]
MIQVGIRKTKLENLEGDVEKLLELIGYVPSRAKILLKPNIVVASPPEEGVITHPRVIEALVRYFRKRKKEVVVAEGTGIFSTEKEFENLLQTTQYDVLRDELNVPIINLEQVEREKIPWRYGFILLPKLLGDYEYINVPTMKTHLQAMVSLGVKNQKGLISMETKKIFHKRDLHACIFELSEVIQPTLTLVDAIYCIEGTGPTGPPVGEVKRMDLLVAGKDMMSVDNVCVQIMGFHVRDIRHLRSVANIQVLGEEVEEVRSEFKRPMAFFSRDHFVVHMDEKACTMCTVSFYKALSKILYTPELREQLEKRKDPRDINIIMGPLESPSDMGTCALCIGDCAAGPAKKRGLPLLKGCHPDYREIVNFLFPGTYPEVNSAAAKREKDV